MELITMDSKVLETIIKKLSNLEKNFEIAINKKAQLYKDLKLRYRKLIHKLEASIHENRLIIHPWIIMTHISDDLKKLDL